MIYLLITMYDRAVAAYQPIANVRHEGEALRVFSDLIRDPNSSQSKHPDDYDLYLVGHFDDQAGKVIPLESPKKLADGKAMAEMHSINR